MKIVQLIISIFIVLPCLSIAQKQESWKVQVKKKTLEWVSINDTLNIKLVNVKQGVVSFSYLFPEKVVNCIQTIIIMDESRKEIKRVAIENNKASFNLKELFGKSERTELYAYSIATPKDIMVARRARIATQFIGKLVKSK